MIKKAFGNVGNNRGKQEKSNLLSSIYLLFKLVIFSFVKFFKHSISNLKEKRQKALPVLPQPVLVPKCWESISLHDTE